MKSKEKRKFLKRISISLHDMNIQNTIVDNRIEIDNFNSIHIAGRMELSRYLEGFMSSDCRVDEESEFLLTNDDNGYFHSITLSDGSRVNYAYHDELADVFFRTVDFLQL